MKRILSCILTLCLLAVCLCLLPRQEVQAAEVVASGTCGDNVTWELDDAGTLTISGNNAMTNYSSSSNAPWYNRRGFIKSVVIGDGVTSIGDYAFYYCTNLTSVIVPISVTTIGDSAFYRCSSLSSVTLPNSVTSIGSSAFSGCDSLTSITIPNSITVIGDSTFSNCIGLTSVTISGSISTIGRSAFYGCESLPSITIPGSVTTIDSWAFAYCSGLKSVTIPNTVTTLGEYAFYKCTGLTGVTIGSGITSIDKVVFGGCSSLKTVTIPNNVTRIGDSAFSGCSSLTEVTIPYGVTRIGDSAFNDCSSLTGITIPNSVTGIESSAFSGCTGLTAITIPGNVTGIGQYAFSGCTDLTNITLSSGLKNINSYAFQNCSGLTSVTIPDSVDNIGISVFSGCSSLTGIWVDENNSYYCSDAKGVLFNNEKTTLIQAPGAISGAYTIPNSVESISLYAFQNCSNLTSITIPNSVTSIANNAFRGCASLTGIWVDENNSYYCSDANGVLLDKQKTTLILAPGVISGAYTIPNSVESISSYAFQNCSNLTSITIPDGVTSIGTYTFHNCGNLATVTLPDSVTSIDFNAFLNCSSLKSVFYGGTEDQKADIFINMGNNDLIDATWYYKTCSHSWGDWVQTKAPSEIEDGISTRTCSVCGETETKPIPKNPFTDVKADRFESAILWAYYKGITSGTGDGTTFSPENACTRKQIVTFLWRAAGQPEPKSMVNPFTDVKSDRFEKAILWAYYEGITSGTGDGTTFSPEDTCTRKQIVTFLWRYHGCPEPASMKNPFVDVKSDRFEKAILWAYYAGITSGTGDGTTFSPENPCTRKQIVTFLYRDLTSE